MIHRLQTDSFETLPQTCTYVGHPITILDLLGNDETLKAANSTYETRDHAVSASRVEKSAR
jgi:hypothetical protein